MMAYISLCLNDIDLVVDIKLYLKCVNNFFFNYISWSRALLPTFKFRIKHFNYVRGPLIWIYHPYQLFKKIFRGQYM